MFRVLKRFEGFELDERRVLDKIGFDDWGRFVGWKESKIGLEEPTALSTSR